MAGEEWSVLSSEDRLLPDAWAHREAIYLALLDLVPRTGREEALRDHMLEDVQLIATIRQLRENMALNPINSLFWFAAISRVALVSLPFFVFRPNTVNLVLLSVYGAYTGFVMFVIYAMERLLKTEIGGGPGA